MIDRFMGIFFVILGLLSIVFRKRILADSWKPFNFAYYEKRYYTIGIQIFVIVAGVLFVAFGILLALGKIVPNG